MLEIIQLDKKNFNDFRTLLLQRGEAPEDYYRWKYLMQPVNDRPTGLIAYLDGDPVGCIGIINRIYLTKEGKEYPATWFSDWFVSDLARGKGIGEKLMQEVRKITSYNFGIPGPDTAQAVCKRSGYYVVQGLFQYTLYLNSFRCGYKRFRGSRGVKFLRGIKSFLFSMPVKLRFFTSKTLGDIIFEFPDQQRWSTQSTKATVNKGHLKRTPDFIQWIKLMPTSTPRSWWSIANDEIYTFGYIETDFWGLKRAVIMDIQVSDLSECIWKISAALAKAGADWITFCYFDESISLKHWTKNALPLHAAISTPIDRLHMTDLDKDSSWRSFLFA